MLSRKPVLLALSVLFLTSLACNLVTGTPTKPPAQALPSAPAPTKPPIATQKKPPSTTTQEKPPSAAQKTELKQWGVSATASSQYGDKDWAAAQATGAPNTKECGDKTSAWASSSATGVDWLEVTYASPVTPTQINIYETYNPGSIVKVELRDTNGDYHSVYTASPSVVSECPRTLVVDVKDVTSPVNAVRISLDQTKSPSWNEIDAVELVGLK
jgi:hypothetical protein